MPRVFACLAVSDVLILLGTAALGLLVEGRQIERHILLAVFTLVITCLIQAVFFTYFAVTGKLVVQAVTLGNMDPAPVAESKGLKRKASLWLGVAMAGAMAAGGTGAARWGGYLLPTMHLVFAFGGIVIQVWAFIRQYDLVCRNAELLARTLRDYETQRQHVRDVQG